MELRQSNFPARYTVAWTNYLKAHVNKSIGRGNQSDLARKVGISPTIISQLLNDKYVSKKMLDVIAKKTGFLDYSYNKPEKSIEHDNTGQREVPSDIVPESKPEKHEKPVKHGNDADIKAIEKYVYSRQSAATLVPELRPKMMEILIKDLVSEFSELNPQQLC